jgi:hypothetical protein
VSAVTGSRTAAVALLVSSLAVVQSSSAQGPRTELDVTAVAITSPGDRTRSDHAFEVGRLRGRDVATQASATATSDCDDCVATSSAVTVSYVKVDRTARADNVAQAWSSCAGCESHAVSVQVVVLRRAASVRADNRALAANAGCSECSTSAVAYQLVVVSPEARAFDDRALEELRRWAAAEARAGKSGGPDAGLRAARPPSADASLARLEQQVRRSLGQMTTVRRDADVVAAG